MSNPAAGWYPDPAGSTQQRWWDGTNWTASLQDAAPAQPVQPVSTSPWADTPATPSYGANPYTPMTSMPAATPYSYAAALPALSNANPSTPFIWGIAFLPLVSLATIGVEAAFGGFSSEAIAMEAAGTAPIVTPSTIANYALTFISYLVGGFLAFADQRELRNRGIDRPFAWGWAFIPVLAPLTYLIGRSVIVRGRTGRGLAPLFTWIGVTLGTWLISFVVVGILVAVLITNGYV